MLRIAATAVVLGLLVAGRAAAQGENPADLQRWDFTLKNVHYYILLPRRATTVSRTGLFSASLSERLARQLHLRPATRGGDAPFARVEKLSEGAVLRYNVDYDVGAGSGGTEGELEGVLEIGTRVLAVTCVDQAELFTPRPEWCLEFLRHLGTK